MSADQATSVVAVPLRGCRRALGAVLFEGVRIEPGGELDLLDRADELGRSSRRAIENTQLLDDVVRSQRELENTFDSIAHLVVVSDRRGRIVRANQAFAAAVGSHARQAGEQAARRVHRRRAARVADRARKRPVAAP